MLRNLRRKVSQLDVPTLLRGHQSKRGLGERSTSAFPVRFFLQVPLGSVIHGAAEISSTGLTQDSQQILRR